MLNCLQASRRMVEQMHRTSDNINPQPRPADRLLDVWSERRHALDKQMVPICMMFPMATAEPSVLTRGELARRASNRRIGFRSSWFVVIRAPICSIGKFCVVALRLELVNHTSLCCAFWGFVDLYFSSLHYSGAFNLYLYLCLTLLETVNFRQHTNQYGHLCKRCHPMSA
jgi:hypothetical protein